MANRPRLLLLAALLGTFVVSLQIAQTQSPPPAARFHHVHLNSTNLQESQTFYQRVFGAQPVKFRGVADALFTSRGFILLSQVNAPPKNLETTAIRHIGWAGVNGPGEFEWWKTQGLDFHTPLTPLGEQWFFYIWGPSREIAEVYTGDRNHLFNHVHFSTDDVNRMAGWFESHLGMTFPESAKRPRPTEPGQRWGTSARLDGVSFVIIYKDHYYADSEKRLPVGRPLESTQGSPVDHIGFSYEDIDPVFARMQQAGVRIVEPIAHRPEQDLRSFFVMGPDNVLIEIVEAEPIPDGLWR